MKCCIVELSARHTKEKDRLKMFADLVKKDGTEVGSNSPGFSLWEITCENGVTYRVDVDSWESASTAVFFRTNGAVNAKSSDKVVYLGENPASKVWCDRMKMSYRYYKPALQPESVWKK